ncbi:hypothetical protein [Azonexus hydrophilus]|uniref:hypothetical protein n=1 Tax=Azonexus hydrophilus TaxID=418702 RepID=UPI002490047A|nr:hypothetical protein [Azonexus hydrophilus]
MTTLIDIADAIVTKLRAALPDVPTISADPPPQSQRAVRVPAIYLDIAEFEPISNPGDGRISVDARFDARCLVDPNAARSHLAVRELAARTVRALQEIRRPIQGHGHIRIARAGDDNIRPMMDGYEVWTVEFGVEIYLGELEPAGITPTEIYFGMTPAIGPNHVPD